MHPSLPDSLPPYGSNAMDCHTVRSLLVSYLDGELAPAQAVWIEAHQEVCEACSAATARLKAQSAQLARLPPPAMSDGLARDLFARMDIDLDAELDGMTHTPTPAAVAPRPARPHRLPSMAVVAYAAVLGAALAWGWWGHDAASTANTQVESMRVKLERSERLRARALPIPQDVDQYRTVAHSRGRGHL